jgi:hypothetical protein
MKVSIGITSIIGWLASGGGMLPIVIKTLEEGQHVSVAGPEKYFAIFGIVSGGITQLGRYLQAHALAKGSVEMAPVLTPPVPSAAAGEPTASLSGAGA